MEIKAKGVSVSYIQYGEGEDVVLLHGWGQNISMMVPLGNELKNKRITVLDLPGFGQSGEPEDVWTIYDYRDFLKDFLDKLEIKKPIIIGHSFGGRIAICYAAEYEVEKVVLFGAPCVRDDTNISFKTKVLKGLKKVPGLNLLADFAKKHIGSTDYKNASPKMRDILVQIVNQDLSLDAKAIKVPTLLIWGSLDEAAPVEDAKKLEALLDDGALIVLEGYTHYAYLEALNQVVNILDNFI